MRIEAFILSVGTYTFTGLDQFNNNVTMSFPEVNKISVRISTV